MAKYRNLDGTIKNSLTIGKPSENLISLDNSSGKFQFSNSGKTSFEAAQAINVATTYYIDGDSGDDDADGLSWGTAWRTTAHLNHASSNPIPREINQNVTVYAQGTVLTYDNVTKIHTQLYGFHGSGSLTLEGVPSDVQTDITPTGYQNTQSHIDYHNYITVDSAGWTVNAHRGQFVQFTTSPSSTTYYPILSNTSDTLQVMGIPDLSGSTRFKIIAMPKFKGAYVSDPGTIVNLETFFAVYGLVGLDTTIANIDFSETINPLWDNVEARNNSCRLYFNNCYMKNPTIQNCDRLYSTRSFWDVTGSASLSLVSSNLYLSSCLIGSSDATGAGIAPSEYDTCNLYFTRCRFSNQSVGLHLPGNVNCQFAFEVLFENCTKAIAADSGSPISFNTRQTSTVYSRFKNCTDCLYLTRPILVGKYNQFLNSGSTNELIIDDYGREGTFSGLNYKTSYTNLALGASVIYVDYDDKVQTMPKEYDNTTSGLTATSIQEAIDELAASPGGAAAITYWATSTSYTVGREVLNLGLRFRCNTIHTSGTFLSDTDLACWDCVSENGLIVSQASHGLAAEDVVYEASGTWAKAKADAEATLSSPPTIVIGGGTNYFLAANDGRVTVASHGLVVNSVYYLSAGTAGSPFYPAGRPGICPAQMRSPALSRRP